MNCNGCQYLTPDRSAINPCPVGKFGCLREVESLYEQTTIFEDLESAISSLEVITADIETYRKQLEKEREAVEDRFK